YLGGRARMTVVLLTALSAVLVRPARPCPFCGIVELTLRERIETPDHSLLVEWVSGEEGNIETNVPSATTFRVIKVWRGAMSADQPLTTEHYYEGRPGERSLLIGNRPEDGDGVIRWDRAIPLTPEALVYVENLPPSDAPATDRLRHAFEHLESADDTIANDAFSV